MNKKNLNSKVVYLNFTSIFIICALVIFVFAAVMFFSFRASLRVAYDVKAQNTNQNNNQLRQHQTAPVNRSVDPMVTIPE